MLFGPFITSIQNFASYNVTPGYTGSQGSTVTNFLPANRAVLIGDSSMANVFYKNTTTTISTATGVGFVVSNATATIVCTGNHQLLPGQYVYLYNSAEWAPPLSYPYSLNALNGAWTKILSVPNTTTFTVSAVYGGSTLTNGDYTLRGTAPNFGGWTYLSLQNTTYSSWFKWLQMYNGNPFRLLAIYATTGTNSAVASALVPKILAGPAFDYAFLQVGTNDILLNATSTSTALVAANSSTIYIQNICQSLLAYGARVILGVLPPVSSTYSSAATVQNANIAFAYQRIQLLQYAMRTPGVTVVDFMRNLVDTNGNMNANYADPYTPGVYPLAQGLFSTVKNESARLSILFTPESNITAVSTIDDAVNTPIPGAPYPNLLANGWMSGTVSGSSAFKNGSLSYSTGTLPTGWVRTDSNTCTGVFAGQSTRVVGTNQNSNASSWGYELTSSVTWTNPTKQTVTLQNYLSTATINSSISAAGTGSGIWLKAGFTVRATNTVSNLAAVSGAINLNFINTLTSYTNNFAVTWGNPLYSYASSTLSSDLIILKPGDILDIWSDEFFLAYGTQCITTSSNSFAINITSNTGTTNTCSLAIASAFLRQVQNPYS